MQGIFQKENTDKALKYGIYRHLPTYEKIIRNLVSFYIYISASKNGSQYLDSLGGEASVSASGSYTCNTFLLEAEERREESL